ncbi:hypothetical protein [Escherichia phage BYEP01]|nr:hypothetical protein [Escherichia phage BYEP01]
MKIYRVESSFSILDYEDGVELLNVVHAGDFSVVPRSAVVAILN